MQLRKTGTKLIKPLGSEKADKGNIPSSALASAYPEIFFYRLIRDNPIDPIGLFLKRALLDGFVSLSFRRLNSLVMAVAMDPKPTLLKRNAVMKFRNQKARNLHKIEII